MNMVTILMMPAKMATPVLLKIKVFWNKGYDVIIFVHDVTSKIFSRYSIYTVGVVMWPKFGNSSISMREIIITLTWGMVMEFYTSVAKGLKLKVSKFCGLIYTFVEVAGEKLVWGRVGFFCPPILNRVNTYKVKRK